MQTLDKFLGLLEIEYNRLRECAEFLEEDFNVDTNFQSMVQNALKHLDLRIDQVVFPPLLELGISITPTEGNMWVLAQSTRFSLIRTVADVYKLASEILHQNTATFVLDDEGNLMLNIPTRCTSKTISSLVNSHR